ncbi:MAG: SRPBCC family protein [Bacteroidia bacterium]|nr:SRPBCC family protein [Bacteroidia bacterium]
MELIFRLQAPAALVFEYLTDMQLFASVHPVISRIAPQGNGRYQVYETLQLGFIPVSFTYPVSLISDPAAQTVLMQATVMGVTHIEMKFVITTDSGGTVVSESVRFRTPLPVKWLMRRVFRRLHQVLFDNIGQAAR